MDQETQTAIAELRNDVKALREDHRCPQDGCRYMESKGGKAASWANWLAAVGLIILVLEKIIGGLL